MRAYEFIKESASAGATSAGNVATLAMPQMADKEGNTFFGNASGKYPKYGDTSAVAVIRRPKVSTTEN